MSDLLLPEGRYAVSEVLIGPEKWRVPHDGHLAIGRFGEWSLDFSVPPGMHQPWVGTARVQFRLSDTTLLAWPCGGYATAVLIDDLRLPVTGRLRLTGYGPLEVLVLR